MICKAELDECPIFVKAGSILPMAIPGRYVEEQKDKELYVDIYPDENGNAEEYLHYQDNGEDFAYLNGEYNLYRFTYMDGEVKTEMVHQGYKKAYKQIERMSMEMKKQILND